MKLHRVVTMRRAVDYARYRRRGPEYVSLDLGRWLPWLLPFVNRFTPGLQQEPIFVIGLRRSGTTLLFRMLTAHPYVHLFKERLPGDRGLVFSTDSPAMLDGPRLVAQFVGPLVHARRRRWGAVVPMLMGDLPPEHFEHPESFSQADLDRLLALFPGAHVVVMLRDPRDLVLANDVRDESHFDRSFWIDQFVEFAEFARDLSLRPRTSLLRLEDLVGWPEISIRTCCAELGLPFDAAMLDARRWPAKGPSEYDRTKVLPASTLARRQAGADPEQLAAIVERCRAAASRVGYDL